MGICSSCESTSVATAKLILQDGQLQEFPYPVRVSYVLQNDPSSSFICNSDDMEFEGFVSALRADEELVPGHLYFVLALKQLRYPLQAQEMAALAVKASLALGSNNCGNQMVSTDYQGEGRRRSKGDDYCCTVGSGVGKKLRSSCSKGGPRNFTSQLTIIQEEE